MVSQPGGSDVARPVEGVAAPTGSAGDRPPRLPNRWWTGLAIVLVAANLRPAVVAVAPLLDRIRTDVGLSAAQAGLLTTLPVLCFGALSPTAPWLIRRFGFERTIFGALIVLCAGIAARAIPSSWALYLGSLLAGMAIAVGNVSLPGLIKRDFPHRVGMMTGVYSMSLAVGGTMAAGLTIPIGQLTDLDWRGTLASWGLFAVVAALVWLPQVRHRTRVGRVRAPVGIRLWRDPLAWQVTAIMGLQALNYYGFAPWIPSVLGTHGISDERAGWLLSMANFVGIGTSLFVPVIAARMRRQRALGVWIPVACAGALIGLLAAPGLVYLWMILLGLAQCAAVGLALALIVLRASDTAHASQLSSMAQTFGYMFAAIGPIAVGGLHDLSDGWTVPVLFLLVLLAMQALAGVGAGRDRYVGMSYGGRSRREVLL